MAPKQEISKKNKKAKTERAIEDLTFGLKNKNKSHKVKEFINQVHTMKKNDNIDKDAVNQYYVKYNISFTLGDYYLFFSSLS
jgi:hypothetical protein